MLVLRAMHVPQEGEVCKTECKLKDISVEYSNSIIITTTLESYITVYLQKYSVKLWRMKLIYVRVKNILLGQY